MTEKRRKPRVLKSEDLLREENSGVEAEPLPEWGRIDERRGEASLS